MSRAWLFLFGLVMPFSVALADTPAAPSAPPPAITRVTEKLPVSAFAELDYVERARISPDGTHMVGVIGVDGRQSVFIMPLFRGEEAPLRIGVADRVHIDDLRWVGNDDIIAHVRSQQYVEGDTWYLNRIIAMNRKSRSVTKPLWDIAAQNASDVLWVPHDGTHQILMAAQTSIYVGHDFWPKVFKVDIETGRWNVALEGQEGINDWSADAKGDVRVGVAYDDDRLQTSLKYRRERNAAFRTIDRSNEKQTRGVIYPFAFLPGGDEGLVVGVDKNEHATIDEYDLAHATFVKTLYTAPGFDAEPIVSADGVTLLGVRTEANGATWFDPTLSQTQSDLAKAVPNASVDITSISDDRKRMLVLIHGPDMPGAIYFYQTDEGVLHRMASIKAQIGNRHLAEARLIHYKARDGLEIEAKLTLPSGRDLKNLPIVVLPHGGPWSRDDMDFDFLSQFVANRGYLVLQPNFRGSDGYGTAFESKSDGELGRAMQDDISDGLKWAVSQGYADPKRACIFGWSYGGYAAMWGIVKDPDQYRCAISVAGLSSVNKQMHIYDNRVNERAAKYHWSKLSPDFDQVSPINFVEKIKAPLLLIHGKMDVTVDVSQSRKMNAKMREAGKTVEYVELPLADHDAQRAADRETLLSAVDTFLAKYNPADPAAAAKP